MGRSSPRSSPDGRRCRSHPCLLHADRGSVAEWVMLLIFAAGVVLALIAVVGPQIVEFARDAIESVNSTGR